MQKIDINIKLKQMCVERKVTKACKMQILKTNIKLSTQVKNIVI